ncbi:hypothetical protein [Nocardioides sp. cx-173]|uniref:hypothetical protein n=1 Tax=Nocardioides sp. cx-173 TaxID=2898796 RepID=UPI001E2F4E67|nr:hypothetical protein [Nocardioides sp. cx-173]MCD4524668.1 hypothetical protein [Nocardioides sp. cx-173]UGB42852.1 hypothetical protein LQ940_04835 [Nocardioides sp. cx-173]
MERVALLLGACATLTTLVAWAVTLAPGPTAPPAATPAPPAATPAPRAATPAPPAVTPAPPAGWQVVERHGGRFAVPPVRAGWRVGRPGEELYYADRRGEPAVGVAGPAVLDEGYCVGHGGPSNRAFAGLLPPAPGTAREVVARLTRAWAAAVAAPDAEPAGVRVVGVRLADGSSAVQTHTVVPVAPGPCRPARAGVDLVSTQGASGVVTLVLVRDLGRGSMSQAVARRIVTSLRR